MLPTLTTRPMEFNSIVSASTYLNSITTNRYVLPISKLSLNEHGLLNYTGSLPIDGFKDLPVTDFALSQFDSLAKIPSTWAKNTEPGLHAHSINTQYKRQEFGVTVVVESKKSDPSQKHVTAIVVGDRSGISNANIVKYLAMREIDANVVINNGSLQVHFGDALTVEALPEDNIKVMGYITNQQWAVKSQSQPSLETGLYTLRLICTNGAYSQRKITQGRSMAWASSSQVERLLETFVNRVQVFQERSLQNAAAVMSNTILDERDRDQIKLLVQRNLTESQASQLLDPAVSAYDYWNVITAAANLVNNPNKSRQLQIHGGALLDKFLA